MFLSFLLVAAITHAGAAPAAPAAVSSVAGPSAKGLLPTVSVPDWLAKNPLAADAPFHAETISRGEHTTLNIARVRTKLRLHFHKTTEEVVYLISGTGRMRLGERTFDVKAGDSVLIPKGVVHSFENTGAEPAVALSFLSPAFDGSDRVFVNE